MNFKNLLALGVLLSSPTLFADEPVVVTTCVFEYGESSTRGTVKILRTGERGSYAYERLSWDHGSESEPSPGEGAIAYASLDIYPDETFYQFGSEPGWTDLLRLIHGGSRASQPSVGPCDSNYAALKEIE
jgi:hypothetical protein